MENITSEKRGMKASTVFVLALFVSLLVCAAPVLSFAGDITEADLDYLDGGKKEGADKKGEGAEGAGKDMTEEVTSIEDLEKDVEDSEPLDIEEGDPISAEEDAAASPENLDAVGEVKYLRRGELMAGFGVKYSWNDIPLSTGGIPISSQSYIRTWIGISGRAFAFGSKYYGADIDAGLGSGMYEGFAGINAYLSGSYNTGGISISVGPWLLKHIYPVGWNVLVQRWLAYGVKARISYDWVSENSSTRIFAGAVPYSYAQFNGPYSTMYTYSASLFGGEIGAKVSRSFDFFGDFLYKKLFLSLRLHMEMYFSMLSDSQRIADIYSRQYLMSQMPYFIAAKAYAGLEFRF